MKQLQPSNSSFKNTTSSTYNNNSIKKLKSFSNTNSFSHTYKHTHHNYNNSNTTHTYPNPNNQNFFFNSNSYQLTQNIIKIEPTETYLPQTRAYFANPTEFKQEPIDYVETQNFNYLSNQQQTEQQTQSSSTLVNHLLKDKQVLNLLDKVAQTLRPPTQSMYQVFFDLIFQNKDQLTI